MCLCPASDNHQMQYHMMIKAYNRRVSEAVRVVRIILWDIHVQYQGGKVKLMSEGNRVALYSMQLYSCTTYLHCTSVNLTIQHASPTSIAQVSHDTPELQMISLHVRQLINFCFIVIVVVSLCFRIQIRINGILNLEFWNVTVPKLQSF